MLRPVCLSEEGLFSPFFTIKVEYRNRVVCVSIKVDQNSVSHRVALEGSTSSTINVYFNEAKIMLINFQIVYYTLVTNVDVYMYHF